MNNIVASELVEAMEDLTAELNLLSLNRLVDALENHADALNRYVDAVEVKAHVN